MELIFKTCMHVDAKKTDLTNNGNLIQSAVNAPLGAKTLPSR